MSADTPPRLAAVKYQRGFDINPLIFGVVADLKQRRHQIGGVLQQAESADDCARLMVVDIRTGERAVITQDRGKESAGCKLDPRGLADISHCINDAIAAGVELIIINKFGRAESEGAGLLTSFADAMIAEIPLLTTVREPYLDAWQSFHGGYATELPPRFEAIVSWCANSCRKASHQSIATT